MTISEMTVQDLYKLRQKKEDVFLLDVRNPDEYKFCNIGGYLIPLRELANRLKELDKEKQIIVHCHSGVRSHKATEFLLEQGFKNVQNLRGGIAAWSKEIDPSVPVY